MPRREVCLIDSDEEDEDGNLNKQKIIKSEILPFGEVVYLPECPSNFKPEEEEEKGQTHEIPVVYLTENSEFENKETKVGLVIKERPIDIKYQVSKSNQKDQKHIEVVSKNTSPTSSSKSDDNNLRTTTPPIKRGNADESSRCMLSKKAKYERQATPLCDAIMKEYSKRQKHVNHRAGSSELSDVQIKEMLNKAQKGKDCDQTKEPILNPDVIRKEKTAVMVDSGKTISKDVKFNMVESQKGANTQKDKDPLSTSAKCKIEDVNIKPVIPVIDIDDPQSPVNDLALSKVKMIESSHTTTNKLVDSSLLDPSVDKSRKTVHDDNKKTPEQVKRRRGRPQKSKVDVDLPEKVTSRRMTRSARKSIPPVRYQGDYISGSDSSNDDPTYVPDTELIVSPVIQLRKKDILPTIDPKSKADSNLQISELPTNTGDVMQTSLSSSSNSNSFDLLSTSKINRNTHESTLPKPEAVSLAIRLKLLVDKVVDALTSEASPNILSDAQKLLQATQELLELQTMRQSLPTESQVEREIKRSNRTTPKRADGSQFSEAHDRSFHDKCTLVQDYFTSYKEVFDSHVVNSVIPVLSEVLMLCMDESAECLKRRKHAENTGCTADVQREILFNSKLMSSCSEKFFSWFNLIVDKIIKTGSSKANMVTLISFVTGSLLIKAPKYKTKFQEVRKVLIGMSKAHNYTSPLLWNVLQTPELLYQEEIKFVVRMLKYFKQRQLLSLSVDLISNLEEALLVDNCALDVTEPSNATERCESSLIERDQSSVNPSPNLSDIAVQFVEALQTEQQCGSKRIEGKLDHILSVLSRNNDLQSDITTDAAVERFFQEKEGKNISNDKSKNILDSSVGNKRMLINSETEESGSMLGQLFESDQSGLDSLFSSYNKATMNNKVQVKIEPVEESLFVKSSNNLESTNFVTVKQEPEEREHEELFPFASVWTNAPESFLNNSVSCPAVQDICEVEDNSIFKQEPSTF